MKEFLGVIGGLIALVILVFMIGSLHGHFASHAAAIAHAANLRANEQHDRIARANHERRLAWQKAHPLEYARQKAEARAAAMRLEQQHIAAARAAAAAAAARARAQQVAAQHQAAEEAATFRGEPDCLVLDTRTLHSDSDGYVSYVYGTVTNKCDHDLGYVQVEINFYQNGNLASSGLANANNLGSGDSWQFKAIATVDGAYEYRVEKLTGF